MINNNVAIDFKKFYLMEFFDKVRESAKSLLTKDNFIIVDELLVHLKNQDDIVMGLEVLAREPGSSELSIFLFDIIDRMVDYPPTLIFDSLSEMVDDFVNTLNIMLEESSNVAAIKKVNQSFKSQMKEVEEFKRKEEMVEKDIVEEKIKEPKEKITKKEKVAERQYTFEQFMEIEYTDNLKNKLMKEYNKERAINYCDFYQLLINNLNFKADENTPVPLTNLLHLIKTSYPWKLGQQYNANELMDNLSKNLDSFVEKIDQLNKEYPKIVAESLKQNSITIIPEKKLIREELPEEPVTIDKLLSDYFQADVNDYLKRFHDEIIKLKNTPEDSSILKNLIAQFDSFKEICMIHGYSAVEDFSKKMIHTLSELVKKRKKLSDTSFDYFEQIFTLLESTEKLRDARKDNPQIIKLHEVLESLKGTAKKKKAPLKEEVISPKTKEKEIVREEEPQGIHFTDKDSLFKILHDLGIDLKPVINESLVKKNKIDPVIDIIKKMKQGTNFLQSKPLESFLNNLIHCITDLKDFSKDKRKESVNLLSELYDAYWQNFPQELDFKLWQETHPAGKDIIRYFVEEDEKLDIGINDVNQLLDILVEIEEINIKNFKKSLKKIFKEHDELERKKQYQNFQRLHSNLSLLNLEQLKKFTERYLQYFDPVENITMDEEIVKNLENAYRMFVDSLKSKKFEMEIENIISLLAVEKIEKKQDEKKVEEETEEDLNEIFKQESLNYLDKIDSALKILETNISEKIQYNVIERNIHSLKSSAHLMNYNNIVNLAGSIEQLCEYFYSSDENTDKSGLAIIKDIIENLKNAVKGEEVDWKELSKKLSEVKRVAAIKKEGDAVSEIFKKDDENLPSEEKPLFKESAIDDSEMLEIFKDESKEFIHNAEEANLILKNDPFNKEAIHKLEHASHSIKSAAMMLGFREIGQIGDGIERIAENIKKGMIENSNDLNNIIARAIRLIKTIIAGEKVNSDNIADILRDLDFQKVKKKQLDKKSQREGQWDEVAEDIDSMNTVFLKEGGEFLDKINSYLLKLEKKSKDKELLNSMSMELHNLKGSAQLMNFKKIGDLAHKLEDCVEIIDKSDEPFASKMINMIFSGVDEIQNLMESLKKGAGEKSEKYDSVISEIDNIILSSQDQGKIVMKDADSVGQKIVETEKTLEIPQDSSQVIKITTDYLDKLINMAAELVVNKAQLLKYLEALRNIGEYIEKDRTLLKSANISLENLLEEQKYISTAKEQTSAGESINEDRLSDLETKFDKLIKEFQEAFVTIDTIYGKFNTVSEDFQQKIDLIANLAKHLHEDILKVRMVPIENLFNRFPRAVRDIAHKQSKKVNLIVEGEKTEVDRAMIESLSDPVMHLIRNAIDHGIEEPEEREKKGKDPDGIILLKARQDKNQIIIEVQDDGRGIDINKVKDTILAKELADKKKLKDMSEEDILNYLFHPRFSTKDITTKTAGRGIGLSVVTSQVKKMKGDIRVSFTPDKGTIFKINVPLTLIISQAMLIESNGEMLALPVASIEETIQFEKSDIIEKNKNQYLKVKNKETALIYLNDIYDYGKKRVRKEKEKSQTAILINEAGTHFGLVVDKIIGREEIVIKSLGDQLSNAEYVSGGAILGDGTVILIIDTHAIVRKVERDIYGMEKDFSSIEKARKLLRENKEAKNNEDYLEDVEEEVTQKVEIQKKKIKERKPNVLIVDDSISVRKFVASILNKNNYQTVLASNGDEALDQLEAASCDLVITDLEMPKLHGFDLIERIRKNNKYDDLPIIILTGRAGDRQKERGIDLGANAFIVKPFKEVDLLRVIKDFIEIV